MVIPRFWTFFTAFLLLLTKVQIINCQGIYSLKFLFIFVFCLKMLLFTDGEDDFGTGDYTDTGETPTDEGGPGFVPDPARPSRPGGGGGGGARPSSPPAQPAPRLPPIPRPQIPQIPSGGGGAGGGGGRGGGGNYPALPPSPAPRPPPYNPRPWVPRPPETPSTPGVTTSTPKPWLQDGIEENNLWNRLFNFAANLVDGNKNLS